MKAYVVVGKPIFISDEFPIYPHESSVHQDLADAQDEVSRRARLEPGEAFIVMEATAISESVVEPQPVKTVKLGVQHD